MAQNPNDSGKVDNEGIFLKKKFLVQKTINHCSHLVYLHIPVLAKMANGIAHLGNPGRQYSRRRRRRRGMHCWKWSLSPPLLFLNYGTMFWR